MAQQDHLVNIIFRALSTNVPTETKKVSAAIASVANAGATVNAQAKSQQQAAIRSAKEATAAAKAEADKASKIVAGLSSTLARVGSLIPTDLPLGNVAKDVTRIGAAALGSANALKAFGGSFGAVAAVVAGGLAAMVALRGAFVVLRESIKAAGDQQESVIRMGIALKTMGQFSSATVQESTRLANAMQAVTKYTDNEVLSAQALLAQLGKLRGEGLQEATVATLDLASALGRDLPTAALIMAKAAQGSTFELRKYGLVIDENIPRSQRWAAALAFVQQQYGGAAQAELKGFNATVRQFGGTIRDVFEVLGSPLLIPATQAIQTLNKHLQAFVALREKALGGTASITGEDSLDSLITAFQRLRQEQNSRPEGSASWVRLGKDIDTVTDKIRQQSSEIARRHQFNEVLRVEQFLTSELVNAWNAYNAAKQRETTGSTEASRREVDALRAAFKSALNAYDEFRNALGQRVKLDTAAALDQLDQLKRSVADLSLTPQQRIGFLFDPEIDDFKRKIQESFLDPEIFEQISRLDKTPFLKEAEEIRKIVQASLDRVSIGEANIDDLFEAQRAVRRRLLEGLAEQVAAGKAESVAAAVEILKVVEDTFTRQGALAIEARLEIDNIRQVQSVLKSTFQSTQFKGEAPELFSLDEIENTKQLAPLLDRAHQALQKIVALDPKDAVQGYNNLMLSLAQIPWATERARTAWRTWAEQMEREFLPSAKAAGRELMRLAELEDIEARRAEVARQLSIAIQLENLPESRRLLQEYIDLSAKLPKTLTIELEVKQKTESVQKLAEEIDTAPIKKVREELEVLERQFRLAIDVQDLVLAQNLLNQFIATASKLDGKDITLDLEIRKMKKEYADALDTNDKFTEELMRMWQSSLNDLGNMPTDLITTMFVSPFEAAVRGVSDNMSRMASEVRRFVAQILQEIAKLLILRAFTSALTAGTGNILALNDLLPPGLATKPRVPTVPLPLQFATMSPFALAGMGLPSRQVYGGMQAPGTNININAMDAQSIRRSLETGSLGRELVRMRRR